MSTTFVIPERDSVRSCAKKYLVSKIGFYVRPEEPKYDADNEEWIINCKTIFVNYVSNKGLENKKFVYDIKDVGMLRYKEVEGEYHLLNRLLKSEVDRRVSEKYLSLTEKIEKEILLLGRNGWGKLTLVKYYLSPLYTLISNLLNDGYLSFSRIKTDRNFKFFTLLLNTGYVDIESDDKTMFTISNELIRLREELYKEQDISDIIETTEMIVGRMYGENYEVIKDKFGIRPPSSYIDTTKAYYFDAIRYGEIIKVLDKDILTTLYSLSRSVHEFDYLNFRKSLLELVNASLLQKDEEYFFGNPEFFEPLFSFRNEMIEYVNTV